MSKINGRGMADLLAAALDASPINIDTAGTAATIQLSAALVGARPIMLGCSLRAQTAAVTVKIQSSSEASVKTVHSTFVVDAGEQVVLKVKDYESVAGLEGEVLELAVSGLSPEIAGTAWAAHID